MWRVFSVVANLVLPQEMLLCLRAGGAQLWVACLGFACQGGGVAVSPPSLPVSTLGCSVAAQLQTLERLFYKPGENGWLRKTWL